MLLRRSGRGVGRGSARGRPGRRQSTVQPSLRRDCRQGKAGHQRRHDVCRHRRGRQRRLPGARLSRFLSISFVCMATQPFLSFYVM